MLGMSIPIIDIPQGVLLCIMAFLVFLVAYVPVRWMKFNDSHRVNASLSAFASGVFLAAGLLHLLPVSREILIKQYDFPWAELLMASTFLFCLGIEHMSLEYQGYVQEKSPPITVVLTTLMLIVHAVFEGLALGLSQTTMTSITLGAVIIAHKWTTALAIYIMLRSCSLKTSTVKVLFMLFVLATPLAMGLGYIVLQNHQNDVITGCFNAMAAGTFLYMGTLHGLSRSVMVEHCCNMREFTWVIGGFILMAVLAIWI